MLLTVKYLSHEIGFDTNQPIHSKIAENQEFSSRITITELMKFIGSMNFYSKIDDIHHSHMQPLKDKLHDNVNFDWKNDLETLRQQVKISIARDVTLALSNTNHPFLITLLQLV